jgi:hypothetical protein
VHESVDFAVQHTPWSDRSHRLRQARHAVPKNDDCAGRRRDRLAAHELPERPKCTTIGLGRAEYDRSVSTVEHGPGQQESSVEAPGSAWH